jgi:DnaJ-class molecular chaperone
MTEWVITMQRACQVCQGTGAFEEYECCNSCNGSGAEIKNVTPLEFYQLMMTAVCAGKP